MSQKNDKNTKLILIKNRRILTRTELSKQKFNISNNENNFIYQTPKPQEKKTFKCIQRKNQSQLKINLKDAQCQVFWKTSKIKRVKSQLDSNQTTQELKQLSDQRNKHTLMLREKSLKSRLFYHRGKIFSHQNLNQRLERPKTKHSKSSSKIHQQNQVYINAKQVVTLHQESLRNSQHGQFQKGSKVVNIRLKTKNFSTIQRLDEILENIYKNKRSKLRINSKQYSLDVKSNIGLQEKNQINELNDSAESEMLRNVNSARTQNKNQSMKLPKDLITKINSHSRNLRFSSNQETPKNKKIHKSKQTNIQNQNRPFSQKLHQENTEKHETLASKAYIHKKVQKKEIHHLVSQTKVNNHELKTLSIQDIKIDFQNHIQSSRQIQQTINCQTQTKNEKVKRQWQNEPSKNGNKQFLKNGIQNNQKKRQNMKLKQEVQVPISIKNKDKASIYVDTAEMDFIEEINLDQNRKEVQKVTKRSNQNAQNFQQMQGKFLLQQNTQKKKREKKDGQKIKQLEEKNNEKFQSKVYQSRQNLKRKFFQTKQKLDYLACTGEVAGYCLQMIPKKNLLWMAPSLLLYSYCFNVSQQSKQVFAEVLKNQLCSQNQYQTFIQQNELLKSNLHKLYQKAKKKGVLNEITESLMCESSDCTRKSRQFFLILFQEVSQFTLSLTGNSTSKDSQKRKNQSLCGVRMILSLLKALKSEFQDTCDQESNDQNIKAKMFATAVEIPEIKLQDSTEKKAQAFLSQMRQFMQMAFHKFRELSNN